MPMKRWWSWIALATTASALWGCGYSCPNGSPVGLYGCVVTCADLPADAGFVCVRPGDEQTFDDASGDRAITDGFGDAGDALSSDANDVVDMGRTATEQWQQTLPMRRARAMAEMWGPTARR
jgi:hypothetical protein